MTNQNTTKQITAKLVKSNVSEHLVWEISVTNSRFKKHYCKTALSCIFLIKKEKSVAIEFETLRHLQNVIAKQKLASSATESATEAQ